MKRAKQRGLLVVLLVVGVLVPGISAVFGQTAEEMAKAPKVYIDCQFCDLDYIRTEIPFVNYVRDRHDAQVHVLITWQLTGGGGREYTLTFLGQKDFVGKNDTLKVVTKKTATDDERRQALVRTLKLGLVRYVAYSPISDKIKIGYARGARTTKVVDRWKNWVFSISSHVFANGEQSRWSGSTYGSFTVKRVTPEWKLRFSVWGNRSEDHFKFGDREISSVSRSHGFSSLVVRSLGEHWSVGSMGDYSSSTYSNLRRSVEFAPLAFEFDFFPYSQSTLKMLTLRYGPKFNIYRYYEETIYDKIAENPLSHELALSLTLTQPWGSVETTLTGSQYLHDLAKNRLQVFSSLNLRLFGGFSVQIFGSVSRIHDQLSLPKKGASREEVLLRRKILATTYDYFVSVGFNYTFGSIYTNVVNPRFGSGGGRYYYFSVD